MAKKNKKSKSKAVALGGVILGAAVGAAAGVLLTPESSKKIKKDIRKKVAGFYKFMAPKPRKVRRMGGKDLDIFAKSAFEGYVKNRGFSKKEEAELRREVSKYLGQIKKHLK